MLARVDSDPDLNRPYSIVLPRIAFELMGFAYDAKRKQPTTNYIAYQDVTTPEAVNKQYVPVPYDFYFNLYIAVKNETDGNKIIEQILPFFDPIYTPTAELIEETNATYDIPISLSPEVSLENSFEGDFAERQAIIFTLKFTLKGYIFGPVKKPGLIKFVNVNFYIPKVADDDLQSAVGNTSIAEAVNVQVASYAKAVYTFNISNTFTANDNVTVSNATANLTGWVIAGNATTVTIGSNNATFPNGSVTILDITTNATATSNTVAVANIVATNNHSNSINYQLIDLNDDWGYATWVNTYEANNAN
jgi:hypothetical protein